MSNLFRITTVIVTVLLVASSAVSAQEKKKLEKRITVVSVDESGVKKDTTIITTDTLEFNGEAIVINTRAGRHIMRGTGEGDQMIWIEKDEDSNENNSGSIMMQRMHDMIPMRMAARGMEAKEGVFYNISVDGVVVTIRAPREKAAEADQILEAAKKVLMKE